MEIRIGSGQTAIDADVAQVHVYVGHRRQLKHVEHQADDFDITGRTGIAIEFGTQLDRAARGAQRARTGLQHAAGVAQAHRTFAAQAVGVHARDLRCDVGAETHLPTGLRVGDLEGTQVQILAVEETFGQDPVVALDLAVVPGCVRADALVA